MRRRRRKYGRELEMGAVRLLTACGYNLSQVAQSLDINESLPRR